MILFIDNYDSFTYNLVHYFGQLVDDLVVARNDKISLKEIQEMQPDGIVISPGPGTPDDAGISCDLIREFHQFIPILGVCLGHQCIGQVFGAKIIRAPLPVHGKTSDIFHEQDSIFTGLPSPFPATRYHSLIIDENTLPEVLKITARTSDGLIMGIEHRNFPVVGVQFHPESILTEVGPRLIKNWLQSLVQKQNKAINIKNNEISSIMEV